MSRHGTGPTKGPRRENACRRLATFTTANNLRKQLLFALPVAFAAVISPLAYSEARS